MSPDNDRCTSQALVSPRQEQPGPIAAAFSSSRALIHSSTESIRRISKADHRVRATKNICDREEQNHPRMDGVKGSSRPFDAASRRQYRWRRRYGPGHLALEMA